jgi:predicted CoA-binding protein
MTIEAVDTTPGERLQILRESRTVALVGVSPNPLRSSNFVATYLTRTPYTMWPVNPHAQEVLGLKCYPTLRDLPGPPDIVDCFRKAAELPAVVEEAIEVGAKVVWFQLGLRNEEAAAIARSAGLKVVQDRCLKIEHARFAGGLHLAGFDTGLISSKRRRPV